jgi:hypothetical protein
MPIPRAAIEQIARAPRESLRTCIAGRSKQRRDPQPDDRRQRSDAEEAHHQRELARASGIDVAMFDCLNRALAVARDRRRDSQTAESDTGRDRKRAEIPTSIRCCLIR